LIGDGFCNDKTNNAACNFDGGDCCGYNINTNLCSDCKCYFNETCVAGTHPYCCKSFAIFSLMQFMILQINPAVTYAASQHQGRLFWIVCKRPAFLSSFSRLKLIQNSAPSVAGMRQCDIRMSQCTKYACLGRAVDTCQCKPNILVMGSILGIFSLLDTPAQISFQR
jgi:hypothetical protein